MKRTKLIAMLLHVLVFMSFILPFQRCNFPRAAVECPAPVADSACVSTTNQDSVKHEVKADSIVQAGTSSKAVKEISMYDRIVSFIFFDRELNYTGFTMITSGFSCYKTDFGFLNAFILLLVGFFILRFRKKESNIPVLIIDSIGLVFLLIAKGDMWGYWVCIGLWAVMVAFDVFLVYKLKKMKS